MNVHAISWTNWCHSTLHSWSVSLVQTFFLLVLLFLSHPTIKLKVQCVINTPLDSLFSLSSSFFLLPFSLSRVSNFQLLYIRCRLSNTLSYTINNSSLFETFGVITPKRAGRRTCRCLFSIAVNTKYTHLWLRSTKTTLKGYCSSFNISWNKSFTLMYIFFFKCSLTPLFAVAALWSYPYCLTKSAFESLKFVCPKFTVLCWKDRRRLKQE